MEEQNNKKQNNKKNKKWNGLKKLLKMEEDVSTLFGVFKTIPWIWEKYFNLQDLGRISRLRKDFYWLIKGKYRLSEKIIVIREKEYRSYYERKIEQISSSYCENCFCENCNPPLCDGCGRGSINLEEGLCVNCFDKKYGCFLCHNLDKIRTNTEPCHKCDEFVCNHHLHKCEECDIAVCFKCNTDVEGGERCYCDKNIGPPRCTLCYNHLSNGTFSKCECERYYECKGKRC